MAVYTYEALKKRADTEHKLQGHLEHQGLRIAVENRKGSVRSGVDKDGKPWRTVMKHPYGYIKGTKGSDGEEVDAYVGPHKDAPHAFVVHQKKHDGSYDEDKVMLGFKNETHARSGYLKHYNTDRFLGPIAKVPIERLKELIASKKKLVKISEVMQLSFLEELGRIHADWSAP
jgi:Inorganic Pyrophosphatase